MLAGHTTTADDCWFGIWDGRGGGGPWREVHDEPWWLGGRSATGGRHLQRPYGLAHLPGRDYHVGRGALWSALAIGEHVDGRFHPQSPNLWWPDDRAWFAATEIDFRWTLVGGTRALVDELLAHDVLEVVEVGPDDAMTVDSDTVN